MKRLIDQGADGIITDYPDRLLKVLGRSPDQAQADPLREEPLSP